jgi:60kDa lysophospholipase
LLTQGASVHLRNNAGRTPLFLAANAGLSDHVLLLRKSGAHLHPDERAAAEMQSKRRPKIWASAGINPFKLAIKGDREPSRQNADETGWTKHQPPLYKSLTTGSAPT